MLLKTFVLNFIELFLGIFFKLLEFFHEVYDCSFKFYVLQFIYLILIGKHFHRRGKIWRDDTGLIFHIVGILAMSSDMWASFVNS